MSDFSLKNGNSHKKNGVHPVTSLPTDPLPDEDEEYDRGHWGSKAEFILSCVGFSVSLNKPILSVIVQRPYF